MKNLTVEHISNVIAFLNEHADYAVLRNFEGLPDHNKSRDIDIIITRKSYQSIKEDLVKLIASSEWKIVTYLHSDRLLTYVCGIITEEGHTELVQWDFFVNTSVFGIPLMDAKEFLNNKKFNGFLYHVEDDCRFLDKYLYNCAVGSKYPEKYKATRMKAEYLPLVAHKVKALYGVQSVAECDKVSGRHLLLRAVLWNIKNNFWELMKGIFHFLYTFIKNYLCSNTGLSIGFTGPDGSGKTTVINLLIENLGDVFRTAHVYYHFRPMMLGNLGEVAHSAGIKKDVDRAYDKPHRGGKTGIVSSLCRLVYYSLDYILGYWAKVKSMTRITRIVIFDRYYTDIICDSRRSRIYLPPKFLYSFGRLFIPSLNYNILLTAKTETILSRKQELGIKGIEAINSKIDYLKDKKGYYKIINESTPQKAVVEILQIVFEEQQQKNLKRLKYRSCKI